MMCWGDGEKGRAVGAEKGDREGFPFLYPVVLYAFAEALVGQIQKPGVLE